MWSLHPNVCKGVSKRSVVYEVRLWSLRSSASSCSDFFILEQANEITLKW